MAGVGPGTTAPSSNFRMVDSLWKHQMYNLQAAAKSAFAVSRKGCKAIDGAPCMKGRCTIRNIAAVL
ncbi:unnamed protein product [Urochloa humidicola]